MGTLRSELRVASRAATRVEMKPGELQAWGAPHCSWRALPPGRASDLIPAEPGTAARDTAWQCVRVAVVDRNDLASELAAEAAAVPYEEARPGESRRMAEQSLVGRRSSPEARASANSLDWARGEC